MVWLVAADAHGGNVTPETMASIVSLSAGALLANVASVVILIVETTMQRR